MEYTSIPAAQTVVHVTEAFGIRNVVISPGSRNAPLTIGFSENPFFNCFSIVDERSAAFFALGMAQQTKKPVALVCTSGSALLNYYPAISEAYYSRIPLVVLSADRPPYKIDIGDGQTIRQHKVYDTHIGFSTSLKLDITHAPDTVKRFAPELMQEGQATIQHYNEKVLQRAFSIAVDDALPVHVNVPLEEPLYDTIPEPTIATGSHASNEPSHEAINYEAFVSRWRQAKRKMVLVGTLTPNTISEKQIEALASDPTVIVFTETTSNLNHSNFFPSIDSIVFPIEKREVKDRQFADLQPELVLTIGGMIVSKKIKSFLRKYAPTGHWHVGQGKAYDTFFALEHHIPTLPDTLLSKLYGTNDRRQGDYFETWFRMKLDYERKRKDYLKKIPFCDFSVFHTICESLPEEIQLQLSNSSTVRYAQLFDIHASIRVFCNRGTSGIDGSSSTAVGASVYASHQTVLITGDLSFFYDSNAFWNDYVKADFRIVLINNSGGGIFRILPGAEPSENFETFFETKHSHTARHLCAHYGIEYMSCTDAAGLDQALQSFYDASEQPKLLEIFTPRTVNDRILLEYFDFLS